MENFNTHPDKLKFSHHARIRQRERNITESAVSTAMQSGKQIDCKDTKIYTDQDFKIVSSYDNTVITVNKNTRNTRFQLSQRTESNKKALLYKVNVRNNNSAMCELADLYLNGEVGKKNIEEAHKLFIRAAAQGNSYAMCKLSQLYESDELGTPNQQLAQKWMEKAADKNDVYALAVIAQKLLRKYQENDTVESNNDKEKILLYLNKAASKGSTRAIWQLGKIHEEGLLGEKDLSTAIELYVKAAKTGSPASLQSLHNMTLECTFAVEELEEILDNISSFLTTTSIGMAFQIGQAQLTGNLGYSPIRGLKMIEQAALKQYDVAILTLAESYRDGVGCDVNLKLAQYWFNKLHDLYEVSAKSGNVSSLWKLGDLYLSGYFGGIDYQKAESCFKKAIAKSSDPDLIYKLGVLYLEGRLGDNPVEIGVKLIAQAIEIWQIKAASGNKSTYYDLGRAYFFINDNKKAVHWFSKVPSNNSDAQLFLAKIYLDNLSCEKNILFGLEILESIILELGISPSTAFKKVGFTINEQTIQWLRGIADNIMKPMCQEDSDQYSFHEFVLTILAKAFEGEVSGGINYVLSSKYYYQLLVDFNSVEAGEKLVQIYNNQHLPSEYFNALKNWVLQIPKLLESSKIEWGSFISCVLLLAKLYQIGDILPHNIQEAAKWLYVAHYLHTNNIAEQKRIEHDLTKLPLLDLYQKEQIVSDLTKIAKRMKITSLSNYRVMSRKLGDIFYDNKIVNQNIDESAYWYTESANTNNSLASLKLAKIYQYDKQVVNASIKWYMLSAQIGRKEALEALQDISPKQEHDVLLSFLNRYKHQSVVQESELVNIKPLKNLKVYPETIQQKYELGKSYLNLEGEHNTLNAAYWFRKAMEGGSIDAGIELYSMYKSGSLGVNLKTCIERLYLDILNICYYRLQMKSKVFRSQIIPSTLSLLNNVSSALQISDMISASTLNQKIETLVNQAYNINIAALADIISGLEPIILELYSKTTISRALDFYLLAGVVSHALIV